MGPAPQIFSRSKNALRPHCQRMNGLLQPSNWREQSWPVTKDLHSSSTEAAHDKRRFRLVNDERWRLLATNLIATRPEGNAVILAELQKLVSLSDVRSNDGRSSIHRDTRTSHCDCVIGFDARHLLVDVPSRAELHRDCLVPSLQH